MTAKIDWQGQVGDIWAHEWQRTDRSFAELSDELIARAVTLAEDHGLRQILDVGCGAGSTSLALADRIAGSEVLGIDVSTSLIDLALSRETDGSCRFEVADASLWSDDNFTPDLLFSRHGVMFFEHPEAAFAHLADVAAPGARLVFSCFRSPAENAWASGLAKLAPSDVAFDVDAPGPFSFADEEKVRTILAVAGWTDINAETVNFRYIAGAGDYAVADAIGFFNRIGPAARALREADDADRPAILEKLKIFVEENHLSGRVAFPAAAWIWTATRPGEAK